MGKFQLPVPVIAAATAAYNSPTKFKKLCLVFLAFISVCAVVFWPEPSKYVVPHGVWRVRQSLLIPEVIPWEKETTQSTPVPTFDEPLLSLGGLRRPYLNNTFPPTPNHTIPVFPKMAELSSTAPQPENILFAMTTTAKRAREYSVLWQHYMYPHARCLVLLPPSDANRLEELQNFLERVRRLHCVVTVSDVDHYETRMLSVPKEADKVAKKLGGIQWLCIGDDDTFFTDIRLVQRMLQKYNVDEDYFIGAISEGADQRQIFGRQAFGGAGLFMSAPVMKKMSRQYEDCVREANIYWGGDGKLTKCAAYVLGVPFEEVLTIEPGMHQFDVPGSGAGYLQSGLPFISMHHFINGWTHLIPHHLPNRISDDWYATGLLMKAAKFLGGDNLFRRIMFDGGKTLLCLGHSVILYEHAQSPSDLAQIEYTLGPSGFRFIEQLPVRPEPQKRAEFFISDIRIETDERAIFWFEDKDGQRLRIVWDSEGGTIDGPAMQSPNKWIW